MEEQNFTIKYSFNDILGNESLGDDRNDFVNEIDFEVHLTDIHGKLSEVIAKGKISQILFSLAIDHGYPLYDVMDASESILDMSGVLFELEVGKNLWEKIDAYFKDCIPLNYNICYLEYFEILPNYRGKGIGKTLILELIKLAKERNCGRVEWCVLDWNEPAIKFYKKIGAVSMDGWTIFRTFEEKFDSILSKSS